MKPYFYRFFKIFNAAIAYESDSSSQVQRFEISKGYQITNDKNIKDDHIKNSSLSFDEVFIKSSNVGSVKILESLGFDAQRNFFEKVGLMDNLDVDGLNIVSNKLPNSWNAHSKFISYGYGISLSPISLITSFCSLVNGGYKINPKVLKSDKIAPTAVLMLKPTALACPAAGTCRKICLNTAGNPIYLKGKIACRTRRDKALRENTNTFYNMLIIELLRFYSKHREHEQLGARLNGVSDYAWEKDFIDPLYKENNATISYCSGQADSCWGLSRSIIIFISNRPWCYCYNSIILFW